MEVIVKESYEEMSKLSAEVIADIIRRKPRAVLGLATGSTPLGTYKELIRLHKEDGLDFSRVGTFNLDEYVGLSHDHPQSYHFFMWENFFKQININAKNVHIPDGTAKDIPAFCRWYEEQMVRSGDSMSSFWE
jgi:glucosamine-6-phosphate deaminase